MKYSLEQLRQMARTVSQAKAFETDRYFRFVMSVSIATNTTLAFVEQKIREYAQ